jgi:hypothetical protein
MWCCIILAQALSLQTDDNYGFRVGLSHQFGTQGNRVGLNIGAFARSDDIDTEAFLTWSLYKNFSHIETNQSGRESQLTLGLTQGLGSTEGLADNYDWSLASNNTDRNDSVSLYTTIYNDTYQTSQRVLGFGLNIGKFNLRFENDYDLFKILGDYGDRYRTGAIEIGYRTSEKTNFVTGFNIFTGNPEQGGIISPSQGASGKHGDYSLIKPDGSSVDGRDRSIGNAYIGVRGLNLKERDVSSLLGFDNMQLRLGWSSEGIRNAIQNNFHDLIANPRIPVRDIRGKFYFEFGANHGQTLYP